MRTLGILAAALVLATRPGAGDTAGAEAPVLTLEAAKHVAASGLAEARKRGAGGAIAVVDAGGHLLCMERLDGTFPAASRVSVGKARTAALFQKPTRVFEEIVNTKGRVSMTALEDFTPLQGGVPIVLNGRVVGAIGVSGAASAQADDEIAVIAVESLQAAGPEPVTYLPSAKVSAAFAKGDVLLQARGYQVHASRRDKPGLAEIHLSETDIVHVLEGTATFVTGGTVVDGKETGPNEIRGAGIRGGTTHHLQKGDVVVVPKGTPHWFKQVDGAFLYYVVKVG